MKKLSKILIITVLSVFLVAGTAMAIPWGPPGTLLQGVLDNITTAPISGDSSVNVTTDYLSDTTDSYWSLTASGASNATMIIELAGSASGNIFGVYSGDQSVQLFVGGDAGDQVTLSIKFDGSVCVNHFDTGKNFAGNNFGYYFEDEGVYWYSDTNLNSNQEDHMFAYQGTNTDTVQLPTWFPGLWTNNEYILAFEGTHDPDVEFWNYTDMVVMVESVTPAPEPTTMLLLGSGLIGLARFGRKKLLFKKG